MIGAIKSYEEYKETGLPWAPVVPKHWLVKRGKSVLHAIDKRSAEGKEELLTVSSSRGVIPRRTTTVTMFKAKSYAGHKLCWPGDLVINSLWAWSGGLGVSRNHGIISTAYGVYRPRKESDLSPGFVNQLVRSSPFQWEMQVRSKGVWKSRLQLTDLSFLDTPFLLPPPEEQEAIVRFLDHVHGRIDRAIRAKRKVIALLNEQKQAIIHKAVTRGLNPDAPLKPSGIPWLGDIPAHWRMKKLRNLLKERTRRGRPDLPLLSVVRDKGVIIRDVDDRESNHNFVPDDLTNYKVVERGQFAMNKMKAWQGSYGVSDHTGIVSPAYFVFDLSEVEGQFFHTALRSKAYVPFFTQASDGVRVGQWDLNQNRMREIPFYIPSPEEQIAIVAFVRSETSSIVKSIDLAEREIELLREYRTRLTADIVTGKLDVCEAAKSLSSESPEDLSGSALDSTDLEPDLEGEEELEEVEG